jgi:hypothetical protein
MAGGTEGQAATPQPGVPLKWARARVADPLNFSVQKEHSIGLVPFLPGPVFSTYCQMSSGVGG